MKVEVIGADGKSTGKEVNLPDDIFGIEPHEHSMYLAVKQYLSAQRQGTHKTKERGELAFSTRKIKRQKGTGTARAGSIRNPLFRKGGRVFGPRPRDYGIKLNKKVKKLARHSAMASKLKEGGIIVVEDQKLEAPRTKDVIQLMRNLDIEGQKAVFVLPESDKNFVLSQRNIQRVLATEARNVNTYEVLNADKVILFESAVERLV
ncbi:MAG TPA: 50S ribosomal protein L4 [Saprospiraceae bacterium]|nr:50S ribosomal protein L4 [Saprospiraceae bacterium]